VILVSSQNENRKFRHSIQENFEMAIDPNNPSSSDNLRPATVPPLLPKSEPPVADVLSQLPHPNSSPVREFLAIVLSVCLGLFLADAFISLADDSIALVFRVHILMSLRLFIGFFAVLVALAVYVLMAFTPAIPKGLFVPLALSYLLIQLVGFPVIFLFAGHLAEINLLWSLIQVAIALWFLRLARGGIKFGWPLVPREKLGGRLFSWGNLIGFTLANLLGLLPAVMIYMFLSTAGLVDHFTDGFMTLHRGGFTVEVRKYVRADGKTIQLFPMSHVAEGDFYQRISQTFPTNSIILMEGVTDKRHLLKQKISYQRMARAMGLAEQHEKFDPTRGQIVMADVDVDQFTTSTLDLLNLIILIHAEGVNVGTIQRLTQYSTAPDFQERLFDDLLRKRNQHLLEQIQSHLPETEHIIVPWGVAHMPGIAKEIQKAGFHLEETARYEVIRFHRN
jgi:hypothetical protein